MKIKFINVGRNNKNWEIDCDKITYEFMYKQVKINESLVSENIDFTEDGIILAGGIKAGNFEIIS